MKVNFIYVPLIYVGYAFAESEVDLRRFMSFLCVLIIIVAGLGLAQSIIGPTFLNPRGHPGRHSRSQYDLPRGAHLWPARL